MYKGLLFMSFLLISSAAFASEKCVDTRVALFPTCAVGQERKLIQGDCEQPYQAEHTFCADRQKILITVRGKVLNLGRFGSFQDVLVESVASILSADPTLDMKRVTEFVSDGFEALTGTNSGVSVVNCSNAILTFEASVGNVFPNPNGEESFSPPEVVNFFCTSL